MTRLHNIKHLSERLEIHYKTCCRNLKQLKSKFPNEDALNTYVGRQQRFTDEHIERIIKLCSRQKEDQM
jgi:hypothetical protein